MKGTTIDGLFAFLNSLLLFSADQTESIILLDEEIALRHLCQVREWPIPERFTLAPLNSPAVLCHWRVLIYVPSMMMPAEVEEVSRVFPDPRGSMPEESEEEGDQDFILVDSVGDEDEVEETQERLIVVDSVEYEDVSEPEEIREPLARGVEGREPPSLGLPPAISYWTGQCTYWVFAATHVGRVRGQSMVEILRTTHQIAEGLYLGYVEASGIPISK